jgi:seryl-tRNA synthetase
VQSIISVDESRRKLQNELDNLLAESNKISKTIGDLFREGKREEADGMKVRTTEIKEECKGIETNLSQLEEELNSFNVLNRLLKKKNLTVKFWALISLIHHLEVSLLIFLRPFQRLIPKHMLKNF